MSINPVITAPGVAAARKVGTASEADAGRFEEYLAQKGSEGEVSLEVTAELLRLKMLNSALSIGADPDHVAAPKQFDVQGVLDRFLEQLPKGQSGTETVAPGALDGRGPEAAFQVQQSDFEAGKLPEAVSSAGDGSLDAIIDKASRRYGIDSGLIRAVIKAESNYNPNAVSSAGAQGLMQLMPATARGLGVSDSFDAEQNVMGGTRFLKDMLRRYNGNLDEALAAYNWGPGNVDRHGTDALPRETRQYLVKVKGYYTQYVA